MDKESMETIAPPLPPAPKKGDPKRAEPSDKSIDKKESNRSITLAAKLFNDKCAGGDIYDNNCAHFLSDAFIRAGYSELATAHECVEARCGSSEKRPIRARNMWCWFKEMASQTSTKLPKNKGYWAVFQLDETAYWGGHVVIIDTDTNEYYGTANYPDWKQYCYKW